MGWDCNTELGPESSPGASRSQARTALCPTHPRPPFLWRLGLPRTRCEILFISSQLLFPDSPRPRMSLKEPRTE